MEATQTKLAAAQGTLARHRERLALTVRRVQEGIDSRRESWKLDDQVGKLAEKAALLASALGQQRMAVALRAGEQWPAALALLRRTRAWFGGEEAGEQMVRGD